MSLSLFIKEAVKSNPDIEMYLINAVFSNDPKFRDYFKRAITVGLEHYTTEAENEINEIKASHPYAAQNQRIKNEKLMAEAQLKINLAAKYYGLLGL